MRSVWACLLGLVVTASGGGAAAKGEARAKQLVSAVRAACQTLTAPQREAGRIASQIGVLRATPDGKTWVVRPFKLDFSTAIVEANENSMAWEINLILARDAHIKLKDLEKLLGKAEQVHHHIRISPPRFLVEPGFIVARIEPDPPVDEDGEIVDPESNQRDNESFDFERVAGRKGDGCMVTATVLRIEGDLHLAPLLSIKIIH